MFPENLIVFTGNYLGTRKVGTISFAKRVNCRPKMFLFHLKNYFSNLEKSRNANLHRNPKLATNKFVSSEFFCGSIIYTKLTKERSHHC